MRRTHPFALVLGLLLAACTYDPPPQVSLGGPADRRYPIGDPIPLLFSEPVMPASISLTIWPGEKSAYDIEGARLPTTTALVEGCTLATVPCGPDGGLTMVLDDARTTLTLDVAAGLFGEPGRPLYLEVAGTLEDDAGRTARVTQVFPFQIVSDVPVLVDTVGTDGRDEDVEAAEPIATKEGPFLFFAEFEKPPVPLAQQFFIDIQVDESDGRFYALMIDADPVAGADKNTSNPDELFLDKGPEGFMFLTIGQIFRETDGGLAYVSEPFDLSLKIGPISFALIQAVIRGRITVLEGGLTRWDGLMTVDHLDFDSGTTKKVYTEADGLKPATFQILELLPEQVPDTMAYTCDADPCPDDIQLCQLLPAGQWPPAAVCPRE